MWSAFTGPVRQEGCLEGRVQHRDSRSSKTKEMENSVSHPHVLAKTGGGGHKKPAKGPPSTVPLSRAVNLCATGPCHYRWSPT